MANDDPMTNETARWLAAAMLTLADATKRQTGQAASKDDTYKECEGFYNRLFGTAAANPRPAR
jgi:hypothetical protein